MVGLAVQPAFASAVHIAMYTTFKIFTGPEALAQSSKIPPQLPGRRSGTYNHPSPPRFQFSFLHFIFPTTTWHMKPFAQHHQVRTISMHLLHATYAYHCCAFIAQGHHDLHVN